MADMAEDILRHLVHESLIDPKATNCLNESLNNPGQCSLPTFTVYQSTPDESKKVYTFTEP